MHCAVFELMLSAVAVLQFYLAPKIDEDEDMGDEVGES
jgi:hypothetical protein